MVNTVGPDAPLPTPGRARRLRVAGRASAHRLRTAVAPRLDQHRQPGASGSRPGPRRPPRSPLLGRRDDLRGALPGAPRARRRARVPRGMPPRAPSGRSPASLDAEPRLGDAHPLPRARRRPPTTPAKTASGSTGRFTAGDTSSSTTPRRSSPRSRRPDSRARTDAPTAGASGPSSPASSATRRGRTRPTCRTCWSWRRGASAAPKPLPEPLMKDFREAIGSK